MRLGQIAFLLIWMCSGNPSVIAQDLRFILISDTHYGAKNSISFPMEEINQLQETRLPFPPFQKAKPITGLIHCGDILDAPGDSAYQLFLNDFGLLGEKKCQFPVYELFGNHDGGWEGPVRQGMLSRNPLRPGICRISENGLHYSWDWEGVHFVALNSYPGNEWDDTCQWCHYFKDPFKYPQHSLDFLKEDLKSLENPDAPIILLQHYGWDSFSLLWWTEAEREEYFEVIRDYQILGIFHGHNHAVEQRIWKGIPVWAVGSPQKNKEPGDYIVARVHRGKLKVFHRKAQKWKKIRVIN